MVLPNGRSRSPRADDPTLHEGIKPHTVDPGASFYRV